jgi:hypothetical protein
MRRLFSFLAGHLADDPASNLSGQDKLLSIRPSTEKLGASFMVLVGAYYATYHYKLVSFPFQAEYREGAIPFNLTFSGTGENIFRAINKPVHAEPYGILYYVFCFPITNFLGSSLPVLRGIVAATILLTCVAVFLLSYKERREVYLPIMAAMLCYPAMLFFVTPLARPDGLGALLFLLAVGVPWWCNFSYLGIAISVLLWMAAFLTKTYFGVSFIIVSTYLFFFVSIYKSAVFIALSCLIVFASYIFFEQFYPTYIYETLVLNFSGIRIYSFAYATEQMAKFIQAYWSFFVILCGLIVHSVLQGCSRAVYFWRTSAFLRRENLPVVHIEYFLFAALVATAACIYPLGGNPGAYMTYFFQLIMPCLAVAVARMLGEAGSGTHRTSHVGHVAACLLLCANMVTLRSWSVRAFEWDKSVEEWRQVETFVSAYKNVLSTPALVDMIIRQNSFVYDSGFTEYFRVVRTRYPRTSGNVALRVMIWKRGISSQIKARKFDLLVSSNGDAMPAFTSKTLALENYEKRARLPVSMPTGQIWILDFWTPRETRPDR